MTKIDSTTPKPMPEVRTTTQQAATEQPPKAAAARQTASDQRRMPTNGPSTTLGLPPAAAAAPTSFHGMFGKKGHVDGDNPKLMGLVQEAAKADPELAKSLAGQLKDGKMDEAGMKALQDKLSSAGYNVGGTGSDGKYGPKTHEALQKFLANGGKPSTTQTPAPANNGKQDPHTQGADGAQPLKGNWLTTAYFPSNSKMEGGFITARGHKIVTVDEARATGKLATAAVDPKVIPLGTKFTLPQFPGVTFLADDTGGAIKGHHIDIAMSNSRQANNWGRQNIVV